MSGRTAKKVGLVTVTARDSSSDEDSGRSNKAPSLKSPRTARFAEATAVNSPIEAPGTKRLPFAHRPDSEYLVAQPQVSDVGFGYVNRHESVEMPNTEYYGYAATTPHTPMKSPLKSAMKTPGAPPRDLGNILSPTFREEQLVEKAEKHTDKEQARDVKIKARVRLAKFFLRGVNFSCSLVVLSMLAATFSIFNATRSFPPRNTLPPWAENTKTWPQITLLCIACVSLVTSVLVFYGYYRGGHRMASKYNNYYQWFSVAWFTFSIAMWLIGAGILQSSRSKEDKSNLWGWSCNQNSRRQLFQNDVQYDLLCRLQNWSLLCCIIEVVVETLTIAVYIVVFYRIYAKTQLRKSMATRDRARSDLYMAQLRNDTVPPTPGFNIPYSARIEDEQPHGTEHYKNGAALEEGVQYVEASHKPQPAAPFVLQAPPTKAGTPKLNSSSSSDGGFSPTTLHATPPNARDPSLQRVPAPATTDARSPFLSPPSHMQTHFQAAQQQHQHQNKQTWPFPLSPGGPMSPYPPEEIIETQQEHFDAAPGEQVYDSVPIPGAYEAPLSPGAEEDHHHQNMFFPR